MSERTKSPADAAVGGEHRPNYATPPGANIADALAERGMAQGDLAARLDVHDSVLSDLIHGRRPITPETARGLELVLGIPMAFWLRAEARYREHHARIEDARRYSEWIDWAKGFPLREMMSLGWLPDIPAKDGVGRVKALLSFLQVASPQGWDGTYARLNIAYRKTKAFPADPNHLGAWLCKGEALARACEAVDYEKAAFQEALPEIRKWSARTDTVPLAQVQKRFADCGVRLVFVPCLAKSRAAGATRWLGPSAPVIQLSLRGKTDDLFWFTLFHEAAHVLKHSHKGVLVALGDQEDEREIEADKWAADALIPVMDWDRFVSEGKVTLDRIRSFAEKLQIAPGIVVGRLQKELRLGKGVGNSLKRPVSIPPGEEAAALLDPDQQAEQWTEVLGAY